MDWQTEFEEKVRDFKCNAWRLEKWKKRPALVEKNGRSIAFYFGQEYDKDKFDLVEDGWNHDHCELCFKTVSDFSRKDDKDPVVDEGYTNENDDWLCKECYARYIQEQR